MSWIAFSYSVPSKTSSSPRVKSWRRLRRLGAISPTGGIHILPANDECTEAFQWLAQEIRQAGGQALVMHVEQLDGFSDLELMELFCEARAEDYAEVEEEAALLEERAREELDENDELHAQEALAKLQRQYHEIARIDYFECQAGLQLASRLAKLAEALSPDLNQEPEIDPVAISEYQTSQWVTRPQPHVDRLASIWLIRHFINSDAAIRYSHQPHSNEVSFDMENATFGHHGNLCTFETMIRAFGLDSPALKKLAEIVHEVDLRDERYFHPEITGVDAVLKGWRELDLTNEQLEERGMALFESLFALFTTSPNLSATKANERS